jgi:hypothetical protein
MGNLCCILNTSLSCDACGLITCRSCGNWTYHDVHLDDSDKNICPTTLKVVVGIRPNNNEWLRFILCPIKVSAV